MSLDRAGAQDELLRDVAVRAAGRDEVRDLLLARGERAGGAVGLNCFKSAGGTPAPPGHTGLYHGNGIELYYDRPRSDRFDAGGRPILRNDHFDPRELLAEVVA